MYEQPTQVYTEHHLEQQEHQAPQQDYRRQYPDPVQARTQRLRYPFEENGDTEVEDQFDYDCEEDDTEGQVEDEENLETEDSDDDQPTPEENQPTQNSSSGGTEFTETDHVEELYEEQNENNLPPSQDNLYHEPPDEQDMVPLDIPGVTSTEEDIQAGNDADVEDEESESEEESETENIDWHNKRLNPVTLPDVGERIIFFDQDIQSTAEATVIPMHRTMQYQWPGWRNIKRDDTGGASSVNLDMVCHNCTVWRYLINNQDMQSVRIPQTDGNYTLTSGTNDIINGDVFTGYDIDYFGNPEIEREGFEITINRTNENRLVVMAHHLNLNVTYGKPISDLPANTNLDQDQTPPPSV